MHQQLLLDKLALHLAQLHGSHAAAIGREFTRRVLLQADEQLFRRGCRQSGKELFFENGESAFEGFQVGRRIVFAAVRSTQLAQTTGGCGAGFGSHCSRIKRGGGGFKMRGHTLLLESRLARGSGCSWSRSGGGLAQFLCGFHHRLRTPGQAVDAPHPAALLPRFIFIKSGINTAQRSFQRNAGLAPCLDQRPIQRREQ